MKETKKKKFSEALAELIGEIALTLIAAAIGFGIFKLFGASGDFIDRNFDLMVLIGLFSVFLAVAAVVVILMKIFGEKKTKPEAKRRGVDIILDTDVGSDCDDMMALAYLVWAKRNLGIDIRAITVSNSCEGAIPAIRAFFKNLGEQTPALGHPAEKVGAYDHYAKEVADGFGDAEQHAETDDAVAVMRRALTESYDAVILAIGPMTNLAALLESPSDEACSLDGISLVRERCKKVVLMAGDFEKSAPEWNVKLDIAAMRTVLEKYPVPISFVPYECGSDMITGGFLLDEGYPENPLSLAFRLFPGTKAAGGRHSWDPAAAVYAVLGDNELLSAGERVTVRLDGDGVTVASPDACGMQNIVGVSVGEGEDASYAKARVARYVDGCAKEIYSAGARGSSADV